VTRDDDNARLGTDGQTSRHDVISTYERNATLPCSEDEGCRDVDGEELASVKIELARELQPSAHQALGSGASRHESRRHASYPGD
jgi:hypothetical protein